MQLRRFVVVVLVLIPSLCAAQSMGSLGYADADNPSEAVGMIKSTILASKVMLRECSARLPDRKSEMLANLEKWEAAEFRVRRLAEHHWAAMENKEPKLKEMPAQVETSIVGYFGVVEKSTFVEAQQAVAQYCTDYFANLASGVWRQRTPRAYQYLDQALEP